MGNNLELLEMTGPDGSDLLMRISTFAGHAEGRPVAILHPQGTFRAYFWIDEIEKDRFQLETLKGVFPESLHQVLDSFIFSERISIKVQSTVEHFWSLGNCFESSSFLRRDCTFGQDWWSHRIEKNVQAPSLSDELRIAALGALPGFEIKSDTNPVEVGLMEMVREKRGCYPGQEVIEKIISIGSPSKKLVRVQFADQELESFSNDALVNEAGQVVGRVSTGSNRGWALAIVKKPYFRLGAKIFLEKNQNEGIIDALAE